MKLDKIHIAYFIGIGGIGMSALARWFKYQGYRVSGYDRVQTPLTDQLIGEGIEIHFEDNVKKIPEEVLFGKSDVLIIYTPAIPPDNSELKFLREKGFQIFKRSEVLGLITQDYFTIAVAGTHGKTTTSSMIAHVLKFAGKDVTAFLGGVSSNYDSNFLLSGDLGKGTLAVVEADEFDRSFLELYPNIAVITSADADHLDIYGDRETMLKSFREFIENIKVDGELFVNETIAKDVLIEKKPKKTWLYSLEKGDIYATNIQVETGSFRFDIVGKGVEIKDVVLNVPGFHNVENALAAAAVALSLKVEPEIIKKALAAYQGVRRRFEYVIRTKKLIFIDDYAHHPTEITALLNSIRALYPGKKITAVFQPHLFSRTRDFAWDFAESLSLADELILLDIYPAREKPIAGVSSEILLEKVDLMSKKLCAKEDLIKELDGRDLEVIVTLGAGDIDQCIEPIKESLSNRS